MPAVHCGPREVGIRPRSNSVASPGGIGQPHRSERRVDLCLYRHRPVLRHVRAPCRDPPPDGVLRLAGMQAAATPMPPADPTGRTSACPAARGAVRSRQRRSTIRPSVTAAMCGTWRVDQVRGAIGAGAVRQAVRSSRRAPRQASLLIPGGCGARTGNLHRIGAAVGDLDPVPPADPEVPGDRLGALTASRRCRSRPVAVTGTRPAGPAARAGWYELPSVASDEQPSGRVPSGALTPAGPLRGTRRQRARHRSPPTGPDPDLISRIVGAASGRDARGRELTLVSRSARPAGRRGMATLPMPQCTGRLAPRQRIHRVGKTAFTSSVSGLTRPTRAPEHHDGRLQRQRDASALDQPGPRRRCGVPLVRRLRRRSRPARPAAATDRLISSRAAPRRTSGRPLPQRNAAGARHIVGSGTVVRRHRYAKVRLLGARAASEEQTDRASEPLPTTATCRVVMSGQRPGSL
jgi:hypothetical protein